jgi:hypothetical protein
MQDRGIFESSREDEDEEDEDYSLGEDMLKNRLNYKYDEDWHESNRIVVPKSEIRLLKEDLNKDLAPLPDLIDTGISPRPSNRLYKTLATRKR